MYWFQNRQLKVDIQKEGGLEIPVEATVKMETSSKNMEAMERASGTALQGASQLMDSLKTVQGKCRPAEEIESSSDEDDQDIASEQ